LVALGTFAGETVEVIDALAEVHARRRLAFVEISFAVETGETRGARAGVVADVFRRASRLLTLAIVDARARGALVDVGATSLALVACSAQALVLVLLEIR
jgi:hypothetical protein